MNSASISLWIIVSWSKSMRTLQSCSHDSRGSVLFTRTHYNVKFYILDWLCVCVYVKILFENTDFCFSFLTCNIFFWQSPDEVLLSVLYSSHWPRRAVACGHMPTEDSQRSVYENPLCWTRTLNPSLQHAASGCLFPRFFAVKKWIIWGEAKTSTPFIIVCHSNWREYARGLPKMRGRLGGRTGRERKCW